MVYERIHGSTDVKGALDSDRGECKWWGRGLSRGDGCGPGCAFFDEEDGIPDDVGDGGVADGKRRTGYVEFVDASDSFIAAIGICPHSDSRSIG